MTACGPGPDEPGPGGASPSARVTAPGQEIDAVDIGRLQSGVGDRLEARVESQREHALGNPAPDLRLADPRDDAAIFELLGHCHAGLNTGTYASPCSRNSTCTGMPIATSSAAQPTMFVIKRRSACSSSATIAIT